MTQHTILKPVAISMFVLLSACTSKQAFQTLPEPHQPIGAIIQQKRDLYDQSVQKEKQPEVTPRTATTQRPRYELVTSGNSFINQQKRTTGSPTDTGGDITLKFKDADIHEIARTILGDILNRNYAIDERIKGKVSLHTSQPVSQAALIPILESMLISNGAILHDNGTLIEIVPQSQTLLGSLSPQLKLDANRGYQMLVVPLRYIAAAEMVKILKSVGSEQTRIELDEKRNLMLLTGTRTELATLLDTIDIFDVNQLRGMSIGLFQLESVDTQTIVQELEGIFGEGANGQLAGMVRFVPIERLNTLLIITPQRQYLDAAYNWIERLDRSDNADDATLHVYKVKHSTSEHLAGLLDKLFEHKRDVRRPSYSQGNGPRSPSPTQAADPSTPPGATPVARTPPSQPDSLLAVGDISIIADDENNALLIMATDADYALIESALRKLDVLPMQVLVEASIVEVTLSDDLTYGLEWFFKNGLSNSSKRGTGSLDLGSSGLASIAPGFSYSVIDSAGAVRAVFNTLASENRVNVVSSPSLMVLDNQSASIRVGDQVPIRTSETTNTGSSGSDPLITSTIQFRDTGVMLEVTPQVKDGGMVVLKINQDVSDVAQTTSSGIDSPTINQRQINTTVAVQSGDTIVLGGLIRENRDNGNSGVPGLRELPAVGWMFGQTSRTSRRTELVVLITPTAITNRDEAQEVTREFRNQLKGLRLTPEKPQANAAGMTEKQRES